MVDLQRQADMKYSIARGLSARNKGFSAPFMQEEAARVSAAERLLRGVE